MKAFEHWAKGRERLFHAVRPDDIYDTDLDGLVQLSVLDRDLTAPPGSPADGDRYLVASDASRDWAGWDLNVAFWTDGAWLRLPPRTGWQTSVKTTSATDYAVLIPGRAA